MSDRWSDPALEGTPERPVLDRGMLRAGHLGGYVVGGDPASEHPALFAYLVRELGVRSVLDVGAAEGLALDAFAELGVERLAGVEGIPLLDPRILRHDYARGPLHVENVGRFDLAWSCEFVEHVEERHVPNFLATFACAELVLMTHALPGHGGHHHVNCRSDDYWVGALAAVGFALDEGLTRLGRALSGSSYFGVSGLAFRAAR